MHAMIPAIGFLLVALGLTTAAGKSLTHATVFRHGATASSRRLGDQQSMLDQAISTPIGDNVDETKTCGHLNTGLMSGSFLENVNPFAVDKGSTTFCNPKITCATCTADGPTGLHDKGCRWCHTPSDGKPNGYCYGRDEYDDSAPSCPCPVPVTAKSANRDTRCAQALGSKAGGQQQNTLLAAQGATCNPAYYVGSHIPWQFKDANNLEKERLRGVEYDALSKQANWMGFLLGEASSSSRIRRPQPQLKHLTIPGTHDTMAYQWHIDEGKGLQLHDKWGYTLTHHAPLTQQLDQGVRWLDVRIGLDEGTGRVYSCHQGSLVGVDFTRPGGGLDMMTKWLDNHPCETIFLMLKPECKTQDGKLSQAVFDEMGLNPRVFKGSYTGSDLSKETVLEKVAGKIVYVKTVGWDVFPDVGGEAARIGSLVAEKGTVQNNWLLKPVGIHTRNDKAKEVFTHMCDSAKSPEMYVNYFSAAGIGRAKETARQVNKKVFRRIDAGDELERCSGGGEPMGLGACIIDDVQPLMRIQGSRPGECCKNGDQEMAASDTKHGHDVCSQALLQQLIGRNFNMRSQQCCSSWGSPSSAASNLCG